jgi:hypothetical protein
LKEKINREFTSSTNFDFLKNTAPERLDHEMKRGVKGEHQHAILQFKSIFIFNEPKILAANHTLQRTAWKNDYANET